MAEVVRSHCIDGMRKALLHMDFEAVPKLINTFVEIDANEGDFSSNQKEILLGTKSLYKRMLKNVLFQSEEKRDHQTVFRIIRMSASQEEETLKVYLSYIRKVVLVKCRCEYERLLEVMEQNQLHVAFVACFSNLLSNMISAMSEIEEVLKSFRGDYDIVSQIKELQDECDSRGSLILKSYLELRKLSRSEIEDWISGRVEGPHNLLVLESYMNEVASLIKLGNAYIASKINGPIQVVTTNSFSKDMEETNSSYAMLEEYYMLKAVKMYIDSDIPLLGSITSSIVEKVFYLLTTCWRRSISTCDINVVIATLQTSIRVLDKEYSVAWEASFIRSALAYGIEVQDKGIDVFTVLNNMDWSIENIQERRDEIEKQCAEVFPADSQRICLCLSELGVKSDFFKAALDARMKMIVDFWTASAVFYGVETASYELSDSDHIDQTWVERLGDDLEHNMARVETFMTANNYKSFVHLLITSIVTRLEMFIMTKRFSRVGGVQLDTQVRALMTRFDMDDELARLTQIATVLKLQTVSQIYDFWGKDKNSQPVTWKLTLNEVKSILAMRVDFNVQDIANLQFP